MKLLAELETAVGQLGELKRAWFTTFNLNLDFFETHVLSTLLQKDKPRNRIDYELMQQSLNPQPSLGQVTPDNQQIDVKIFADKRYYDAGDLKRTAIEVFGVNPLKLNSLLGEDSTCLFHPKVVYLEDKQGRAILGAGSANLTLSGWSANQEVFAFKKVTSEAQKLAIEAFFRPLLNQQNLKMPEIAQRLWADAEQNWTFAHSLSGESFLDVLMSGHDGEQSLDLVVWSPYFPSDIPLLINNIERKWQSTAKGNGKLCSHLIPDLVENHRVRSEWRDGIADLQEEKSLKFYINPIERHASSEITHAKVWMTSKKIGIGSWNFTTPGSNLLYGRENARCNVEAGIVVEHQAPIDEVLKTPFVATSDHFMTKEEKQEHALEVPELLPFDIRVEFDWRTNEYWIFLSDEFRCFADEGWALNLPDIDSPFSIPASHSSFSLPLEHEPESLLVKHCFELTKKGTTQFRGFIVEKNASLRRVEGFASLEDFFNSMLSGAPLQGNPNTSLRDVLLSMAHEDNEEILALEQSNANEQASASLSYFRLFQAMAQYMDRIRQVEVSGTINKDALLEQYAFVVPGCLKELHEKISHQLSIEENVFNWFMAQELNALVAMVANLLSDRDQRLRVQAMVIQLNETQNKNLGRAGYRKKIKKENGYV
ncbi:hypothetical protein FCV66_13495 [Enterovibrio norvegicus]|uniref:hypothetical protein n=1 Tax=Enterovibrio norvegicus TaxID=188144 RepID=UPI0010BEC2F6|nr:hypothetical protein [Enterovibrio norvegicus]TKF13381.1 hypothetical protein FCV66_13495 [Enterovibrio norvegicus]